jgi:hypothetical protein
VEKRCHIIAEVTGSSPVPPTIAPVLSEELLLRELLEAVLGPEGRRRLCEKKEPLRREALRRILPWQHTELHKNTIRPACCEC